MADKETEDERSLRATDPREKKTILGTLSESNSATLLKSSPCVTLATQ